MSTDPHDPISNPAYLFAVAAFGPVLGPALLSWVATLPAALSMHLTAEHLHALVDGAQAGDTLTGSLEHVAGTTASQIELDGARSRVPVDVNVFVPHLSSLAQLLSTATSIPVDATPQARTQRLDSELDSLGAPAPLIRDWYLRLPAQLRQHLPMHLTVTALTQAAQSGSQVSIDMVLGTVRRSMLERHNRTPYTPGAAVPRLYLSGPNADLLTQAALELAGELSAADFPLTTRAQRIQQELDSWERAGGQAAVVARWYRDDLDEEVRSVITERMLQGLTLPSRAAFPAVRETLLTSKVGTKWLDVLEQRLDNQPPARGL